MAPSSTRPRSAARLRTAGHEVDVVTLGVEGPDVVRTVTPWPYPIQASGSQGAAKRMLFHAVDVYNPRAGRTLDAVLDELRPDVVHTNAVQGMSSVALTQPGKHGIAHVHTLHDYWLLCQRNSMVHRDGRPCETRCRSCLGISWIRNQAVRRHPPGVVLAVSQAIANEHEQLGWVGPRMRVLYNPVEIVAGNRTTPRGSTSRLTFGFLGRLGIDKGVGTMLEAFERAALPNARLVVAGRGPLEADVRSAGPSVVAAGFVTQDRKEALLDDIDCLVVPSQWKDPAPVVLNEARGRGIPVIGARIGGIQELVAPECRPLAFPPGDVGALADRMTAYAAAPEQYRPAPAAAPIDWPGHLAGVLDAYTAAGAGSSNPT